MLDDPALGRLRLVKLFTVAALICLLSATVFVSVAYADGDTGPTPPVDSSTCDSDTNSDLSDPLSPNSEKPSILKCLINKHLAIGWGMYD